MPLRCSDPQRSPSGQSVCEEHSVEPETRVGDERSRGKSSARAGIGEELLQW